MNPVDELAAIRALIEGANKMVPTLNTRVLAHKRATKGKAFSSDWGDISFRRNPPKIKYYGDRLVEWARENMPHEVVPEHTAVVPESVRPSLTKTLETRLTIIDGEVVDMHTGAVCEFAYIEPGEPDTVVFTMKAEQKAAAAALVADRLEALAAAVNREVESS